ncbi:MAG: hypothetical protein RIQ52_266 [Pseudomonadota bacterium]|jgi:hypothetical protein
MHDLHVRVLATVLVLAALALCTYKAIWLGLPLMPTDKAEVWTVEARIEFKARHNQAIKVSFALPRLPEGFTVLDENFVASDYGLTTTDDGVRRYAQWAIRETHGWQVLYYRIQLTRDNQVAMPLSMEKTDVMLDRSNLPDAARSAARALLNEVRSKSADNTSFVRELLSRLNARSQSDNNIGLLHQDADTPEKWVHRLKSILVEAELPARMVYLVVLKDGLNRSSLLPWLQYYDGERWQALNPDSGESGLPRDAMIWTVGSEPALDLMGGKYGHVEYSIKKHSQDMTRIADQRARQMGSRIMEYSLFSLPVQTQNVYRVLLLIPVGAFLIVLLRNVVGIDSFGTFMPILIALAFRETELLWGVSLFCLLLGLGLALRFYLEYLKLLLVPRLASVLVIVILLMAMVSIVTNKLGLDRGLSVALFPMVIMAMTIERMSVVWDERGAGEAVKQGLGSLLVAVMSYLVMSSQYLAHWVFVFPELLLLLLAMMLLLGRYTGYRLTELWRFRAVIWPR